MSKLVVMHSAFDNLLNLYEIPKHMSKVVKLLKISNLKPMHRIIDTIIK